MQELLELVAQRERHADEALALATVLRVEGSSYRAAGARMLVGLDGRLAGSVSGGCLEQSVIEVAQAALSDGRARLLSFDTTAPGDVTFGSGLGCQGKIWIGIEVLAARCSWWLGSQIAETRRSRRPAVLFTHVSQISSELRFEQEVLHESALNATSQPASWRAALATALATGRSQVIEVAGGAMTVAELIAPPISLTIFGGGPDVDPLVNLAAELGHDVTVIDRRETVAGSGRFRRAQHVWTARAPFAPGLIPSDDRSVAVVMNHHYETDRDTLAALVALDLPYIAMLGPLRRTDRILNELRDGGMELTDRQLAAIHGPAGLDLGADQPAQIALSILAEIQATLTGREGGKLKYRLTPIHADPAAQARACAHPAS